MAFAKPFHFVILWVSIGIEKGVEKMTDLQVGRIYQIQPRAVDLGNVTLYQDQYIEIISIDKGKVTYRYSENNQVYTHDYFAIKFIV